MKSIRRYISYALASARQVFATPIYWVLAVSAAAVLILVMIWMPNLHFVRGIVMSTQFDVAAKGQILFASLGAFNTNFTASSRILSVVVAALVGINVAYALYYIRRRLATQRAAGVGLLGMVTGLFGIGCSACGSVLLSSLIGVSSAGSLIAVLPLAGAEFSLISIALLLWSILYVAKQIQAPAACAVQRSE